MNFERMKTRKLSPIRALTFCLETLTSWQVAGDKARGQFCWTKSLRSRLGVAELTVISRKGYLIEEAAWGGGQAGKNSCMADPLKKTPEVMQSGQSWSSTPATVKRSH